MGCLVFLWFQETIDYVTETPIQSHNSEWQHCGCKCNPGYVVYVIYGETKINVQCLIPVGM
jgi:hypothetical protein